MKVYACPAECPAPKPDYANYDRKKEEAAELRHQEELKAWLVGAGYKGANTGGILQIPHADGYAVYMLAEGKSSCLIHLPYGDGWNSPMAEGLTKKAVIKMIKQNRTDIINRLVLP